VCSGLNDMESLRDALEIGLSASIRCDLLRISSVEMTNRMLFMTGDICRGFSGCGFMIDWEGH